MPERMPMLDDVNNAQQLARFLQWMADKQLHIDHCLDELKEDMRKAMGSDLTQEEAMEKHLQFHRDADLLDAGRASVWRQQGKILATGLAVGGTVAGMAVKYGGSVIAVFK